MTEIATGWKREVATGQRFEFGENWTAFLKLLNDERILSAENSLKEMLETDQLDGLSFIDAGSGSGLFSLAARRLGAKVVSFDYDPQSVACTAELKRRFFPEDEYWFVTQGSVLDKDFLEGLGRFDVVYSWGVLHHTGAMWQALENVAPLVADDGKLFISIYNDQGRTSRMWARVKRGYVRSPRFLRTPILFLALVRLWGPAAVRKVLAGELRSAKPRDQGQPRGMDLWHDAKDWVGGYPFEVAKPEQILDFYRKRGFRLDKLKTCGGGLGCNEFVFVRP